MKQVIVFPNDIGGVSIIYPIEGGLPSAEVALKDVPAGVPYRFIPISEIPTDRTYRDAWEMDFTSPDGYGIGAEAWFAKQSELQND